MTYIVLFVLIAFVFTLVLFRLKKSIGRQTSKDLNPDFYVLEVQVSKNEEAPRDIQTAALLSESVFSSLHGLLREDPSKQEHISFEMCSSSEGIRFFVIAPQDVVKFVESQIYAQYASAHIRVVKDYTHKFEPGTFYQISKVSFQRENFFPIKVFRDLETDPISSFTSALTQALPGEEIWFQVLARPIADTWQKEGFAYVKSVREGLDQNKPGMLKILLKTGFEELVAIATGSVTGVFSYKESQAALRKPEVRQTPRLGAAQETDLRSIENKLSRMGYQAVIRVLSAANSVERMNSNTRAILASLKQFTVPTLNSFTAGSAGSNEDALDDFMTRKINSNEALILNVEEMATIYHFPTSNIDTPNIAWLYSRKSEPPSYLPTKDCVYVGETLYRNKKVRFGIANNDDRLRHMYIIGKSGTGKSTLLETMITQDINNGFGVGVLDPHGETIERVLERIPDHRVNDVVYFDAADAARPVGLNLLEMEDSSQKNLMASGLVAAVKQHFEYSWGPRLEYLLNYAILTLLDVPGTTLLGVTRLLEDKNYQNYILHQVKDPVVIRFWEHEFKEMKGNQKLVTEAIAPIQNKVNRFLASTTIRNILGQKNSTLDIWNVMNNGKIILINLSKGKIGSDNANLLGALLVSRIQFYALQRAKIPYDQRRPFYLYVDEFQNFATGSFEEILSESRKYKLGLYLTHQFMGQLPEELLEAVYGNVGTIATFGLGAPDAKIMENEFAPYFCAEDIISLERFQVYLKLMVNGMSSVPFSAKILVPWEGDFVVPKTGNKNKVIELSREKYGVPREHVEAKVNKWVETQFDKGMAVAQEYKETGYGFKGRSYEGGPDV